MHIFTTLLFSLHYDICKAVAIFWISPAAIILYLPYIHCAVSTSKELACEINLVQFPHKCSGCIRKKLYRQMTFFIMCVVTPQSRSKN